MTSRDIHIQACAYVLLPSTDHHHTPDGYEQTNDINYNETKRKRDKERRREEKGKERDGKGKGKRK